MKRIRRLLMVLFLFMFFFLFSIAYSINQNTFLLDLDNPVFNFTANMLNDSSLFKDLVFSGSENKTVYIRIPKNSTILYSNITLRGEMRPVSSSAIQSIWSLRIGNVTTSPDNEIVIGTDKYVKLLNNSGGEIWSFLINGVSFYDVDIGNISSSKGREVAAGASNYRLYILNSTGQLIWNVSIGGIVYGVAVGNVNTTNDYDEIAVAGGDNNVYLFSSNGAELWHYSGSSVFKGVDIGNLSSDKGEEIVAGGDDYKVYVFNSSGHLKWNKSLGIGINDVAVGNVNTTNDYDEIAVACANGTVFLLDSAGDVLWSYIASSGIGVDTVSIGDAVSNPGNEVVAGSFDNKVYVIDNSGSLIWSYTTNNFVRGVDVGNLTIDPGNEIAAGTNYEAGQEYNLYILNFEYYPTNVTLDIGNDSAIDWNYSGKFRGEDSVSNNTAFQEFLSSCQPDSSGNCNIPLVFHSDFPGDLNVTSINVTYEYNMSDIVSYSLVSNYWSRTNNVWVNESVGNQVKNITYSRNPAVDVQVKYIKISDSANRCDFDGKSYSNTTINGKNACDISSSPITINSSGSLGFDTLWDDTMSASVPVYMNESSEVIESGYWKKNLTIWNDTQTIFTNVIANTTLNETFVIANSTLKVDWYSNGTFYDITPPTSQNDCNSVPTYTPIPIGNDTFYVCKQDTNGNGIVDLFVWKQPYTKGYTKYEVLGSANHLPELKNINVTPSEGKWSDKFNISVNVTDEEGDNVTVRLYVNLTGTFNTSEINVSNVDWQLIEEKNTTENTTLGQVLIFNLTTNKTWTGVNLFKFEYNDFNSSSQVYYHYWIPSIHYGPNVTKHNASVTMIKGNDTSVNRSSTVLFVVQLNDTDSGNQPISGANCSFWVMVNETNWDEGYNTVSNSSGYCNYSFTPNASYLPGKRWWKAGAYLDKYYETTNFVNYTVHVYGKLNINLSQDTFGQNATRKVNKILKAKIYDEFDQTVPLAGYNCSWYINNTYKGFSLTNSTGYCNYSWSTDCSDALGNYPIDVKLSGNVSQYYFINKSEDSKNITLKGRLNLTIVSPSAGTIYYPGNTIYLNSTMKDYCGFAPVQPYNVSWNILEINPDVTPPWSSTITGENVTIEAKSPVGFLNITAEGFGDLYNSARKNTSAWIYGWSGVNFSTPKNGEVYQKTETVRTLNISCFVYDVNTSTTIDYYPITILNESNLLASGYTYGGNTTPPKGYFNYTWNISELPDGNYTLICNISKNYVSNSGYSHYTALKSNDSVSVIIREVDTQPPNITNIYVNSTTLGNNVTIEAQITDWYGVDKVWLNLTYPNSTTEIFNLTNTTPNLIDTLWKVEIPSSKLTQIGDYDFILYANDTPDSNGTSRTANSTNWFEIYQPIQLYITANYPIDFTFYRPGTKWIVHRFVNSSGYYNFTLHKRNYDFVAKINDDLSGQHTIKFTNMNSTATSELEFGEASNITNPLNISIIPLYLVNPPIPWRHELSALYISQKMSYSNITISLNYSKKIGEIDYEPAIKMYKCSVWVNDSCNSGWLPVNVVLNTSTHTISTVQTNTSVYYAFEAEICGNGICGSGESCYNCPEDCGKCGGGTTGTSGTAGGTTGGITPVCGNDICEAGENEVNCPEDCAKEFFTLKTNLTEAYLHVGDSAYYALWITNLVNKNLNVSISLSQPLQKFISVKNKTFVLEAQKERVVTLLVSIPNDTEPGTYSGEIVVTGDGRTGRLPIVLTITSKSVALDVDVEAITKTVAPNETAKFKITLYDTGEEKRLDVNLTILVSSIETNKTIYKKSFIKSIEATQYFTEYIPIPENITTGSYQITVKAKYDGKESKAMDTFDVTTTFWTSERIREVIILILAASIILSLIYGRKRYILWKLRKARYIFPVDMRTLPTGELWIGKIAETETKATFVMDDLTTHILVAGATGAGKSVTANIFVEELLEKIRKILVDLIPKKVEVVEKPKIIRETPTIVLKKKYQERIVRRIMGMISGLTRRQKDIATWVNFVWGKQITRKGIAKHLLGWKSSTSELNADIRLLIDNGLLREDSAGRIYPNVEELVRTSLKPYDASEEEIAETIEKIKSELAQ